MTVLVAHYQVGLSEQVQRLVDGVGSHTVILLPLAANHLLNNFHKLNLQDILGVGDTLTAACCLGLHLRLLDGRQRWDRRYGVHSTEVETLLIIRPVS